MLNSLKPHVKDYVGGSFMEYTYHELVEWVSLFLKRASHRTTSEKQDKDVYDALNYLDILRFKVCEHIKRLYSRTSKYIQYIHRGNLVYVRADLVGRHRDYCMCFECKCFTPENREENCPKANKLYQFCVDNKMTTPVWECPIFKDKNE